VSNLLYAANTLTRLVASTVVLIAMACGGGGGSSAPPVGPVGAWGSAQVLETNLLFESSNPQVAVDPSGRALVVWQRLSSPGGHADIWAKIYQPGTGWQPEGTIESMDGDAQFPVVAVGGDGAFCVSWQHTPVGATTGIWVNRYVPASGWSGPLQISTGSTAATEPAIAADGSGNVIVAWQQTNAAGYYEVQATRYVAPNSSWSAPVILGAGNSTYNRYPRVAMDPIGNGMVVWNRIEDLNSYYSNVCAWPYRVGLGWGQIPASAPSLQAGATGDQVLYGVSVAMSSAGAVLGWAELSGLYVLPFVRIWNPTTGVWSAAASASAPLLASPPVVGIDATGKVHAAWVQYSSQYPTKVEWNDVFVASYSPGGVWTVPSQPMDTLPGNIGNLSLSVNAAGSAALAWNQANGSVANIYASRFESSVGWGAPTLLETNDAGSAYPPVVRLNASGQAFATWYQLDANSIPHIYANRWN